jgi:hypothetical protein
MTMSIHCRSKEYILFYFVDLLGGTHLTLQDPKLPEGCASGGFCYAEKNSVITRNRFITW